MSKEEENYLWTLDPTLQAGDEWVPNYDEWIPCDKCENACNCPDANRYDGCDCGLAIPE